LIEPNNIIEYESINTPIKMRERKDLFTVFKTEWIFENNG